MQLNSWSDQPRADVAAVRMDREGKHLAAVAVRSVSLSAVLHPEIRTLQVQRAYGTDLLATGA